jgi:hypothetical protein
LIDDQYSNMENRQHDELMVFRNPSACMRKGVIFAFVGGFQIVMGIASYIEIEGVEPKGDLLLFILAFLLGVVFIMIGMLLILFRHRRHVILKSDKIVVAPYLEITRIVCYHDITWIAQSSDSLILYTKQGKVKIPKDFFGNQILSFLAELQKRISIPSANDHTRSLDPEFIKIWQEEKAACFWNAKPPHWTRILGSCIISVWATIIVSLNARSGLAGAICGSCISGLALSGIAKTKTSDRFWIMLASSIGIILGFWGGNQGTGIVLCFSFFWGILIGISYSFLIRKVKPVPIIYEVFAAVIGGFMVAILGAIAGIHEEVGAVPLLIQVGFGWLAGAILAMLGVTLLVSRPVEHHQDSTNARKE